MALATSQDPITLHNPGHRPQRVIQGTECGVGLLPSLAHPGPSLTSGRAWQAGILSRHSLQQAVGLIGPPVWWLWWEAMWPHSHP